MTTINTKTTTGKVNAIINNNNIEYTPKAFETILQWLNSGLNDQQISVLISDNTHFFKPLPLFNKMENNKVWINKTIHNMSDQEKIDLLNSMWDNGHISVTQK